MSLFTDILISLGPVIVFVVLMAIVYYRGNKVNKELLVQLEEEIKDSIDPFVTQIKKVQIRPDEYEFRCKPKSKNIKILTLHLKLVNRSFIIQWIVNFFFKDKERLFLGVKIGGSYGDEDPVYRFDIAPYHRKGFIKQRFETFVEYDDIPTIDKRVDQKFMIKSQARAYVQHFVDNPEFIRLITEVEPYLEHIGVNKAKEDTDPHISATFEFRAMEVKPIEEFIQLFFLVVNQHIQNHEDVKKLIARGEKGKAKARRRGRAAPGGAARKRRKKKKRKN